MKVRELLIIEQKNLPSWIFIGNYCIFAASVFIGGGSLLTLASGVLLLAETYVKPTNTQK
jgi:hypothetical protein